MFHGSRRMDPSMIRMTHRTRIRTAFGFCHGSFRRNEPFFADDSVMPTKLMKRTSLFAALLFTIAFGAIAAVHAAPLTVTVSRSAEPRVEGYKMGQSGRPDGTTLTL